MLKKLFGKQHKPTEEIIYAVVDGKLVNIEQVPDPTFSQKMMGDGVAIIPVNGNVVSPVDGEVLQVFPTKHAVGLKGKTGVEILIHIGLETVGMQGEGFEAHVQQGSKVKVGDPLVTFDLALVKEKANDSITPIVITNNDLVDVTVETEKDVQGGRTEIMSIKVK
ncbi:PTS sugar transporter subunit IIA [Salirhabdus sp. Marseille-P4669]|uniref:PTS sugar transporter subunit IIA n=1 Tax=Salirhabdus sp. Marseille-P4669 TaxID=2042310 RepID=UPI000C79D048|nr:PTS glucose transporter subunit IIA [Salirhabdus sp. Marseille-P4669]